MTTLDLSLWLTEGAPGETRFFPLPDYPGRVYLELLFRQAHPHPVAAVASIRLFHEGEPREWAAYLGSALLPWSTDGEAFAQVAAHGCKLTSHEAMGLVHGFVDDMEIQQLLMRLRYRD